MDTQRIDQGRPLAGTTFTHVVTRRACDERGFAVVATLLVLMVVSILVLAMLEGAMSAGRSSSVDYDNARVYYAAEAGAEAAMAQLADALDDAVLENQELSKISPPSLGEHFRFDSFTVRKSGGIGIERITDGPFAGLYSLTQKVEIFSEAVDPAGNSGAVISGWWPDY